MIRHRDMPAAGRGIRTAAAIGRSLAGSALAAVVILALLIAAVAGCGGAPDDVARVSGTVTLGEGPLADAVVTFQPQGGPPSRGITDANGKYTLRYTRALAGARIGQHVVSITTHRAANDDADPPRPAVPERVPWKFRGDDSELRASVAAGANTIDFRLESGPLEPPRQTKGRR